MAGSSITLGDFKKLLNEDEFIDFFNKFICLPAFSQMMVFSRRRKKINLYPPLPDRYTVNYNGLIEWLWRKRLNLFLRSRFYGEYRLCNNLVHHSLIKGRGIALKTEMFREVRHALEWLQRKCVGRLSALRKFRRFLSNTTDGSKLYQYWLDSERLYFHVKRRSSVAMEIFSAIKEKYFVGTGESKIPQHLLDMAWQSLPTSHRAHGIVSEAKTYDVTFTICLQRLCANRLKNYWMPRYLLEQNPSVERKEEVRYLNTARKYLRGNIKLIPEASSPSSSSSSNDHEKEDSEKEENESEEEKEEGRKDSQEQSGMEHLESADDDSKKSETEREVEITIKETELTEGGSTDQKKGRRGVSFQKHRPPGVSSSEEERTGSTSKQPASSGDSSSEDEGEYRRRMEIRKARSRERRASRETRSMKISDPQKSSEGGEYASSESDSESVTSRDKSAERKTKNSSGASDSAESWEGVHDQYRKHKGGKKKFRFKDRHRRRSLHKRKLKFEELLTKESYRRPSMSSNQVKLFAKGKMDIGRQRILLDDDEKELREPIDIGRALPEPKQHGKHTPFGMNMDMTGGKALLIAALKFPESPVQSTESERPDLFNRSPSLWNLSMDETSQRMGQKRSVMSSSLDSFQSSPSRMSLLSKIGKLRRPGLHRSPSQDSTGSATTVQSSSKKRKMSIKNKPKKTKVTTLTFSLSGDAPNLPDKSTRAEVGKLDTKAEKSGKSAKQMKNLRQLQKRTTLLPTVVTQTMAVSSKEYTMEKDNAYRTRPKNRRMILAFQADQCATQPFRTFLLTTDNEELVFYLGFWQDVEKTRQDFQFGTMSFNNFIQSMHGIVRQYLLYSSPCRIEAPDNLREEAIMNCLSPEMQEMPWQVRKLQKEVMEDLKFAHETFCQQETQSFLVAAAFKKEDRRYSVAAAGGHFLPPTINTNQDSRDKNTETVELRTEMDARMSRSLCYIIEINLPTGRDASSVGEITDESDDDGCVDPPPSPTFIREPHPDLKELATRSVKEYPDPTNTTGVKIALKIPCDRRLQSATLYPPLKRGGQLMKRPMVRPKTFQDVLKDTVHFQFFKRYLKAHRSDMPLSFWNAVENLRHADKMKSRQMKARFIIKKYFHNPKIPAVKLLQCSADIIKEIPYLDVVTTSMLFTAQSIVGRVLEERWFRRYADTFEERLAPSNQEIYCEKTFKARSLMSRTRRLRRIWAIFSDFIKRAASFLRSMRKPHMFEMFEKFLEREVENDTQPFRRPDSTMPLELPVIPSESTILPLFLLRNEEETNGVKQRIINGQLVTFNFLANDLHFWRDIECFKNMCISFFNENISSHSYEEEANVLTAKAHLIVSCYLESDIPPKIRVNIPAEVAESTIESLQNGLIDRALFHEATIYVFPLLLYFWKKFCTEHYRYVPTLSKKHKMIYGLKMTPVIAEQMKLRKKEIDISQESGDSKLDSRKKKKSKRIDTADLPNYIDMDSTKFNKKRGSPFEFAVDEMGPRLTFSIRKGVTLIEPVRRKRLPPGKPILREFFPSPERIETPPPRLKKPSIDIPLPPRSSRRAGLLDASLLQSFANRQ